jgi:hypothetical protein
VLLLLLLPLLLFSVLLVPLVLLLLLIPRGVRRSVTWDTTRFPLLSKEILACALGAGRYNVR